jgi:hypothetical protein
VEIVRRAGVAPRGGDFAVAADPRDPTLLFLAWVEPAGEAGTRLCLRRSVDGGAAWSPDLRIVPQARGAALAVNRLGEVVLVYQQLTGRSPDQRWVVYLEHTTNAFATMAQWVLADTAADPVEVDSAGGTATHSRVIALADAFYGAFVADNTPSLAHFPNGVSYQRHANFGVQRLLDPKSGATVPPSRDPFFFYFAAAV